MTRKEEEGGLVVHAMILAGLLGLVAWGLGPVGVAIFVIVIPTTNGGW
jgi:hypothetical protein